MAIRRVIPETMVQLPEWRMNQPHFRDWMKYTHLDENLAGRVVFQVLKPAISCLSRVTGDTEAQVIAEVTSAAAGSDEPLYGLCDHYHMIHVDILKWIHATLEKVKIDPKKAAVGLKNPYMNFLDYYGKTGELALRVARDTNCEVTFVDQGSWAEYTAARAKMYRLADKIHVVETTPGFPRPKLDDMRFGMISALEAPVQADGDWLKYLEIHLLPHGFVASKADLPWKKVAKLQPFGYIYQYVP